MKKIDWRKKQNVTIALGAAAATIIIVILFVYLPLIGQHNKLQVEVKKMEKNMQVIRHFIDKERASTGTGRLISQEQIVLAIDEITEAGRKFDIDFVSINPKTVEQLENSPYGRLPIAVSVVSEYRNLGLFFKELRGLGKTIVTVESFGIERNEEILPLVRSNIILGVYLKDG